MGDNSFLQALCSALTRGSFIVWVFIWGGSNDVLRLGRSPKAYRRLKKSLSFWDRLTKRKHVALSKGAVNFQYFFIFMTYLFYLCILSFFCIWFISLFTHNLVELLEPYLYIKCYAIELPALFFCCFHLGRSPNKVGITWKFIQKYHDAKKRK